MITFFNFKLLFQCWYHAFFKSKGTVGRLTWKRIKKLAFSNLVIYFPPLLPAMISFALDNILYPQFRTQQVKEPFFVIGNFRSGSTLLQRLLAQDQKNFLAFKTWEFMYAPSILQRRFFRKYLSLEQHIGSPVRRIMDWIDDKYMAPVKLHSIGWHKPEEDESLHLYIFSTFFLYFVYPFENLFKPYFYFDEQLDEKRKQLVLEYYNQSIKRHLFAERAGNRHFLSKNPAFTPKVEALYKKFPDARFIFLVRDPVKNIPSALKLFSYAYKLFNDPPEEYPQKSFFLDIFKHWYLHPLEKFASIPQSQWMIIKYEDMAFDLEGTIKKLYSHFGLELDENFQKIVQETAEKGKHHVSVTSGELERQGFTPTQIRQIFSEVNEKFGYD